MAFAGLHFCPDLAPDSTDDELNNKHFSNSEILTLPNEIKEGEAVGSIFSENEIAPTCSVLNLHPLQVDEVMGEKETEAASVLSIQQQHCIENYAGFRPKLSWDKSDWCGFSTERMSGKNDKQTTERTSPTEFFGERNLRKFDGSEMRKTVKKGHLFELCKSKPKEDSHREIEAQGGCESTDDTPQHAPAHPKLPKLFLKTKSIKVPSITSQSAASLTAARARWYLPSATSTLPKTVHKSTSFSAPLLPCSSSDPDPSLDNPSKAFTISSSTCSVPPSQAESTVSDYPNIMCSSSNGTTDSDTNDGSSGLLRHLIATPSARASLKISLMARQDLISTASTEPETDEAALNSKPSLMSKLEKEIRCVCKHNDGKPCWLLFKEDLLRQERLQHLQLKRETLDLVILAKVAANINREDKTRNRPFKSRQRSHISYLHEGRQICRETFMFIHGISKARLNALVSHYKSKGLTTRVHRNVNVTPKHALSSEDTDKVLEFVKDYANKHCMSSIGRKPGSKAGGGLLVMSKDQSKRFVHYKYKMWCTQNGSRAVSLRTFQLLWNKHLPYIVVLRGSNKCTVPESGSVEELEVSSDNNNDAEVEDIGSENTDDLSCFEGDAQLDQISLPSWATDSSLTSSHADFHTQNQNEPLYVSRGTNIDVPEINLVDLEKSPERNNRQLGLKKEHHNWA